MSVENALRDPSHDQPYAPPPATETLVRNAGDLAVQTTGTGTAEVVSRKQFQSTSQSMQGVQTGVDARLASDIMDTPILVTPEKVAEEAVLKLAKTFAGSSFAPMKKKELQEDDDIISFFPSLKNLSDISHASKANETATTNTAQNATVNNTPLTNTELNALTSLRSSATTKERIFEALKSMLAPGAKLTPEQETALQIIAEGIFANKDSLTSPLHSTNKNKVAQELTKLAGVSSSVILAIIDELATNIGKVNTKLDNDLSSTNKIIQEKALRALAGFSSPENLNTVDHSSLNSQEAAQVGNYLGILAEILAFLSELRATISILESDYGKTTTQAKLETQKKMTELALTKYTSSLNEIKANAEKNLEQINAAREAEKKAKMWGILGPIITAVMTIIAVVVTVASAGTLGPAMTAAVVAATVAMAALTICDQTMGVMDKLCDAMGISKENTALRSFVKFAVMAVIVIGTCGTGALAAAAGAVTRTAVMMVAMMVIQSLFQSGLITEMFLAIMKECTNDPEAQQIGAMVLTMILMLIMILAMAKAAGSTAQQGAQAGTKTSTSAAQTETSVTLSEVDDVASTTRTKADTVAGIGSVGAATESVGTSSANQVAQQAQERALSMVERILEGIKARVQEQTIGTVLSEVLRLLNLIAGCLKVAASAKEAQAQKKIAEVTEQQAEITRTQGELGAILDYLQSLTKGFDTSISKMIGQGGDVEKINELVQSFMEFFKQTIESAQQTLNKSTR